MPFKLQYASNLFVDTCQKPFKSLLKPAAPSLALLGNIGRPESPKTYHFLKFCASNWDTVFWIPGPHELSNTKNTRIPYDEKTKKAIVLAKEIKGVQFMASQEAVFHTDRVVILGSPVWTPLKQDLDDQPEFQSIYTSVDEAGPIPLCRHVRNQLHKSDRIFLTERSLFWNIVHPNVNLVYLTHSLPTPHLLRMPVTNKEWNRSAMDSWTASLEFEPRAWLGGATASTQNISLGPYPDSQTLCAVNGLFTYPLSQYENPTYNPECVMEIEPRAPFKNKSFFLPKLVLPPLLSGFVERKVSLAYA
jgi:hypothetical protein